MPLFLFRLLGAHLYSLLTGRRHPISVAPHTIETMTKKPRYDDKFRASAVVMLQAAGYPAQKGALAKVSAHLNVPGRTLSRWFNGEQNPPPDQTVREKNVDFVAAIKAELAGIFKDMPGARYEASYKDMATAAGILLDKMQLLEGKPTSREEVITNDSRERLAHLISRHAERQPTPSDN